MNLLAKRSPEQAHNIRKGEARASTWLAQRVADFTDLQHLQCRGMAAVVPVFMGESRGVVVFLVTMLRLSSITVRAHQVEARNCQESIHRRHLQPRPLETKDLKVPQGITKHRQTPGRLMLQPMTNLVEVSIFMPTVVTRVWRLEQVMEEAGMRAFAGILQWS